MKTTRLVCLLIAMIGLGSVLFASPVLAGVGVSPSAINFGSVAVNSTGTTTFMVTNNGRFSIPLDSVVSSLPQFVVSGPALPMSLVAHTSVIFHVVFQPNTASTFNANITFAAGKKGGQLAVVSVSGTGTQSASNPPTTYLLSPSASNLAFGNQLVGAAASQTLTLFNTGTGPVTVSQVTSTGAGFSVSPLAGAVTLAAGQSYSLNVGFAPAAAGAVSGSISVVSTASNSPTAILLSGTGVQPLISVAPASISFGSVLTGSTNTQKITVSNSGSATLNISQASFSGTGYTLSGVTLPASIAPGGAASFNVTFTPASAGTFSGSLALLSNAPTSPASIALSGTGVASTLQLSANTTSLSFGSLNTGTSAAQNVTITNTGNTSVTISQISENGAGYTLTGAVAPLTLSAGQSASFSVSFAPATAGTFAGTVTVTSNATNSPLTVSLSGTGVASTLLLSATPASLSFGNQSVGTSASQNVTLSNTGNSSVTVSQITTSGTGFSLSAISLPVTLSAGQTTSFSVAFAPAAAGSVSGTVSVVSNSTNSPATVSLSGTGVKPMISVTPSTVAFGNVTLGVTNTQTITVQNPGTAALTVSQASVTGAGYSLSGLTTPLSIAPGGSSSFNVAFAPASAGSIAGSITLTNNATNPALSIPLSGAGVSSTLQLSASPTSLSFGSLTTGTSATQMVTISNTGNASVTISQVTASGTGFSLSSIGLPVTLTAGQTTSFSVAFAPVSAGSATGSVTVTSNATNSPLVLGLSGTGAASTTHSVSLSWTPSSSSYSGFNVYRGSVSGGPYTKIDASVDSTSSYTDSNVATGQTYYYVVTEVDNTGAESSYSSPVSAVIP